MKKRALSFFLFGIMLVNISCVHTEIRRVATSNPGEQLKYDRALRSLSRSNFKEAEDLLKEFIKKYPTSILVNDVQYHLGLAYEGEKKYAAAVEVYKGVIEGSPRASQERADALYRLSMCYEILGDDTKMVVALIELEGLSSYLPKDTAEMEIPARLAAAYARQGNVEQSHIYYEKAQERLKYLKRSFKTTDMVWLPKTLYFMGDLAPIKRNPSPEEFRDYVISLEELQGWLVRCAEIGDNEWSMKASILIQDVYKSLLDRIIHWPSLEDIDMLKAARSYQRLQKQLASQVDESISKLRLERLPSSPAEPEPSHLTMVFNAVTRVDEELNKIIESPWVQDQDTPEAKAHQGLKREGKIVDHSR